MEAHTVLLQTIAGNTEQILKRVDKIDDHIIRLQREKLDLTEKDRILAESAEVKKDLNDRLRIVEKAMWVGMTIVGLADIALVVYLKIKT